MPLEMSLDPADCGLLIVDIQNGFCHPDGARAQAFGPSSVDKPAAIVPHIRSLVRLAHALGIPVWCTQQVHFPDDTTRGRRRIPSHLERRGVKLELCHRGTWDAELLDELKEVLAPEDHLIVKHRSSAFFETPLFGELRMKGVQVLIVAGTTTSFCVDSTIRDAYARDFDVVVPVECVADTDDAAHDATLASVDRFHGVTTTSEQLAAALGATDVWRSLPAVG
jgi:ureidoacrylate peracid hydrolase